MKKYTIAIDKDINKQYNDAAVYYQKSIDENELNLEVYLNLGFLYWIFQDYGFSTYYNITEELGEIGYQKYPQIIEKGIQQFPNNVELHFWKRYFNHIFFAEEFSEEDCKQLIEKYDDKENIIPYFFLYLFDKEKYIEKRNELLDKCNEHPTAKNIYIKSIIDKK